MNAETSIVGTRTTRSRVLMTGRLFVSDGVREVIIRDLSAKGARLRADAPVTPGSDAILKRKPLFAAAKIVWSQRSEIGIQFYRPLTAEELAVSFNVEA